MGWCPCEAGLRPLGSQYSTVLVRRSRVRRACPGRWSFPGPAGGSAMSGGSLARHNGSPLIPIRCAGYVQIPANSHSLCKAEGRVYLSPAHFRSFSLIPSRSVLEDLALMGGCGCSMVSMISRAPFGRITNQRGVPYGRGSQGWSVLMVKSRFAVGQWPSVNNLEGENRTRKSRRPQCHCRSGNSNEIPARIACHEGPRGEIGRHPADAIPAIPSKNFAESGY